MEPNHFFSIYFVLGLYYSNFSLKSGMYVIKPKWV